LFASARSTVTYTDRNGNEVIGTLRRVPSLDWAVVAEVTAAEAYAQIRQLRDATVILVLGLLVVVGFIAYLLGLLIVRPLDRLTTGAAEVAAGDLAVDLPVGKGEVGYLTEVFNGMVERLREGREQLQALAVTDPLTGIANRRYLMERMKEEARRSNRSGKSFAILMVDVDHFKKFNDMHGHVAGDEALKAVASVLELETRDVDYVARYGGEEFLVLLSDTDIDGAVMAAERIAQGLVECEVAVGEKSVTLTVSAGAAEFPRHGDSPESVVEAADAALYQAKERGRDQVVRSLRRPSKKTKVPKAVLRKPPKNRRTKASAKGAKGAKSAPAKSATNGAKTNGTSTKTARTRTKKKTPAAKT
jgi:diguanylate cyclase (GGDEF)-like protein